jgi:tetrahydromethanopterin S-methyltransferase subunit G
VEIGKQTKLATKMNSEMDKTQEKMNFVAKKLSTLLKTSDMGALYTIMCLSLILFVLVLMVIFT